MLKLFFKKGRLKGLQLYPEETPAQAFSCLMNSAFPEHLRTTTSDDMITVETLVLP